jgi:hypothetical protein
MTPRRYSGQRHGRELFSWLARVALGTSQPCRGTIDANTGNVKWWHGGAPRPIKPAPCPLGQSRGCRRDGCTD